MRRCGTAPVARARRSKRTAVVLGVAAAALVLAACGGGSGRAGGSSPYPEGRQADDRQLVAGRRVYVASCARCHGASGQGNVGPRLAGRVADRFPDIEDQISFVEGGKGIMPGFGDVLTDEEIRAVVRYEREVL